MEKLLNVILIISDTFRYDNLLSPDSGAPHTPNLDKFMARHAASIENYYCGSFPTGPNRTDVVSGRVAWPKFPWQSVAESSKNHMAHILGEAGYLTQLICDNSHLIKPNLSLYSGFQAWHCERGQEGDTSLLHANDSIEVAVPRSKTFPIPSQSKPTLVDRHRWHNRYFELEEQMFSSRTARTTVRWLEENYRSQQPFFLWVDFFDPHEPWDPPEYLVNHYDPEYAGTPMLMPNYGLANRYDSAELFNLRAHYLAEVEFVDRHIGRVFEKIDDLRLWENTVVIFASDHGVSLGEHGRTAKINRDPDDLRYWPLSPELSHVPLMIAAPGIISGRKHQLFAQPVDILPSVLDLSGVRKLDNGNIVEPLHGCSFEKVLRCKSENENYGQRNSILSGQFPGNIAPGQDWNKGVSTPFLVTRDYGFAPIGEDGDPQIFDLNTDVFAEREIHVDSDLVESAQNEFCNLLKQIEAPQTLLEFFAQHFQK